MAKARAVDAFVIWTLSIVLAGLFLLTGVPKILGSEAVGFQASAMRGFPQVMRIIVGVVECVGAIGLLIPATASFAAIVLAVVMVPATLTQYASGEGHVYVPIIVLALLLLIPWRRNAKAVNASYHDFADHPHPLLHDGIIAGLIGASAIAVWFLIIDTIAGQPFRTPVALGNGLLDVLGPADATDSKLTFVLVYTIFHFGAFMFVGLLAALIVHLAKHEPSILLGFVVLFVATEIGFYGLTGLLHEASSLKVLAWPQVMVGNLIAASSMGYYFWRTHRELGDEFRHSLDWDTELVPPEHRENIPSAKPLDRPTAGKR
ncbi:MAG TPA: DoxX family protein [Gemmatimonadaceae bacterium]|nr:DoxX family protein [Gemmatimonadaceae bacterium]